MGVNAVNRKLTETKFVKFISNIFAISLAPLEQWKHEKKTRRGSCMWKQGFWFRQIIENETNSSDSWFWNQINIEK